MRHNVQAMTAQFQILGEFKEAVPYGTGHINDTYMAVFNQGGTKARYILQRINHHVFKNPPALMENVLRVTSHIREKLIQQGANDISRRVLTVIPNREGGCFYQDAEGNYWRAYIFIENAKTYDVLETPKQAYEAAKAFGKFQGLLVDLPGPALHDTIPNFHNGPLRFQTFIKALEEDVCNRAAAAQRGDADRTPGGWVEVGPHRREHVVGPVRVGERLRREDDVRRCSAAEHDVAIRHDADPRVGLAAEIERRHVEVRDRVVADS